MSKKTGSTSALDHSLKVANAAVLELARKAGLEEKIGTTMIAAVVKDRSLYWIAVGDNRVYLYRHGQVTQLNSDHDYGRELDFMAAEGKITHEEAETHSARNALTSYLGLAELPKIDQNAHAFPLEVGDRILLCSDGLYRTLSDEDIAVRLSQPPQEAAEALVNETIGRQRRHQDNVTVAILAFAEDQPATTIWSPPHPSKSHRLLLALAFLSLVAVAGGLTYVGKGYFLSPGIEKNTRTSEQQPGQPLQPATSPAPSQIAEPQQAQMPPQTVNKSEASPSPPAAHENFTKAKKVKQALNKKKLSRKKKSPPR